MKKIFWMSICLILLCFGCSKKAISKEASYDEAYMEEETSQVEYKAMASARTRSANQDVPTDLSSQQLSRKLIKTGNITKYFIEKCP